MAGFSQGSIRLTLNDALKLAQEQSLQTFLNKHYYMADYWAYRSFKADLLPSVSLRANPLTYSNASQLRYNSEDRVDEFIRTENLRSDLNLNVSQKIAATGGTFSMQSELGRIENYGNNEYTQYSSRPFTIGYKQALFGFNAMKWQRKIEPLQFEKAKKEYLESTENMHLTTIRYFFGLVSAAIQIEIAQTNMENTEKLLKVAHSRFELGTVSREELLDLRLSNNNAQIDRQQSGLNYREAKENLLNFLMLPVDIELETVIPENTPVSEVDIQLVLQKALENNPEILQLNQNILESQRNVEQANRARHFQADVNVSYGVSKDDGTYLQSGELKTVYTPEFENYQQLSLGINIPILDWGRRKGQYEMAKSRHEIAQVSGRQSLQQFKQNAVTRAIAFNIQKSRVESAALSDTLANESYELTMTRFSSGQADVLRLTSSQNAKDNARYRYINALADYWTNYYTLRQLTLFDFENKSNIEFDEEEILKK
jgi:outer membrane protein TolC